MGVLSRLTDKRIYSTGTSACLPIYHDATLREAVQGKVNGEHSLTRTCTIDKKSLMTYYINLGLQAILTNQPIILQQIVESMSLKIATSSGPILSATVTLPSPDKCDCDYHKGGCMISWPAPTNKACKCSFLVLWKCYGEIVPCNTSNSKCANPDESREACQLGQGYCDGY